MALKYKLDDVVVLGDNVESDHEEYFTPGVLVRVADLCAEGSVDEHYTVSRVDGKGMSWWAYDGEINHEATEDLQKSNETAYIVGKEQAVSDDNAKEVRTPALKGSDENGWFKRGELPPVGTVCECQNNSMRWLKGTIVYVGEDNGTTLAIMQTSTEILYGETGEFRPIKSPEQIAEEEREKAIEDIARVISSKISDKRAAESLYELGYRKMGEIENE